jgi:catechol 2,3-dioxygenase-like lactoylglutathione lyase family enzyme
MKFGRNVGALPAATAFYQSALGFTPLGPPAQDKRLAAALGATRVLAQRLALGAQEITLSQCFPPGAPCAMGPANALTFQHIAIVTSSMAAAHAQVMQHGAIPISTHGPSLLPGGLRAFKFRDPEGHPLELLEFPQPSRAFALMLGYDHSAISISEIGRSVTFYAKAGLSLSARQLNTGPAQDALDGLVAAQVDVVALGDQKPHVELLHYRADLAGRAGILRPLDLAADRLDFSVAGADLRLQADPDGHFSLRDSGRKA